ncbi:GAF domain-containing protein [Arthrobacter sp. B0490]|uniref:GAF domain-containing protein n=1 Tax=Arthrobacter sp. B0490 TaxID=2058891 RepID=UPI0015E34AE8|nr:GAF domain-containing protein [Arthrobacter sp. B0490]
MVNGDVQQGVAADLVSQCGLNLERVYEAYRDMGGMSSEMAVREYLAGRVTLPELQRDLVAHAVNELLHVPYPRYGGLRAPYSTSTVASAAGYSRSELDGNLLASHQRRLRPPREMSFEEYEEAKQLDALVASDLLNKLRPEDLARLPEMAHKYFSAMGAAITVVDEKYLYRKVPAGFSQELLALPGEAWPREGSFCNETIRSDRTLVVSDTLLDPRFRDHRAVTGLPHVRFYAGHPLTGPNGSRVGALCIVDDKPRHLSSADQRKLQTIAALVQQEFFT